MTIEMLHKLSLQYITEKIASLGYPSNHPFLEYPNTPNGMALELIIKLKLLLHDDSIIDDLLKKCRSIEQGIFNQIKYNQNMSEVIILYYCMAGIISRNNYDDFKSVLYETNTIIRNSSKLEYSFQFSNEEEVDDLINFEVKTITCDPFSKELDLRAFDGKQLIKPFFHVYL